MRHRRPINNTAQRTMREGTLQGSREEEEKKGTEGKEGTREGR